MSRGIAKTLALVCAAGGLASVASGQVLFSNCNIKTGTLTLNGTGGLPAGSEWSECARDLTDPTTANTTAGFGGSGALRLADDFVVPAGGAFISTIRVYAYLTGATTPGVTAATLRILDSSPLGTPTVLFGDQTTNRLAANAFAPIYRTFNTITPPTCGGALTAPGQTRHVQQIDITVNQAFAAGTYWIDFNYTGASFTPCATIASAIGRQCNPANANGLQFNAAWVPLNDAGQGCVPVALQQDIYFEVLGTVGATTGACCLGAPSYACITTTNALCTGQGGTYAGDNVTCAAANCPPAPTGRCCTEAGTCSVIAQLACTTAGGVYGGDGTTCTVACVPFGYTESGDAGETIGTAAVVSGPAGASLLKIRGNIGAANDSDLYQINICDEANFSASTIGGSTLDTQLFLFNSAGNGVVMDDDTVAPDPASAQSKITTQFVTANGDYYLGISGYNRDPVDAGALLIWNNTNPGAAFGPEWAPNGPGAANAFTGWDAGTSGTGAYVITLTGSCFVGGAACYANCDGSSVAPILNSLDFGCFLTKFAQGDPYANCDGSSVAPTLNSLDFGCFLTKFAAGCT